MQSKLQETVITLKENPEFNPRFLRRHSRGELENALAYALNHRLEEPLFFELSANQESYRDKSIALSYINSKINKYFEDPELTKIAPANLGELPESLSGYYLIAAFISYKSKNSDDTEKQTQLGVHFLIQNNDGYFSHRLGRTEPTRNDAAGTAIILPQSANLVYPINEDTIYKFEFIGYLNVKLNKNRTANLQENYELSSVAPTVPRETPDWLRIGDFSCALNYELSRTICFVNQLEKKLIKKITFSSNFKHQLTLRIDFQDIDVCNDFLDALPDDLIATIKTNEEIIRIPFSNQKHFDTVLTHLHLLYPLSKEMLTTLPGYLNTRRPIRVTEDDWIKSYPVYNPEFYSEISSYCIKNCMSYALNIDSPAPFVSLEDLIALQADPANQLQYVAREINSHFKDNNFTLIAPYEHEKLPELKQGYYVAGLYFSPYINSVNYNGTTYSQLGDYHFIVQNNDGLFSHRSGQGSLPGRVDQNGNLITQPEKIRFFNVFNDQDTNYSSCLNYHFVGYLYFKTNETRLTIPNESYSQLDAIEEAAKTKPDAQQKLSAFKNRFFMFPPLPEFFPDTQTQITELHRSIT